MAHYKHSILDTIELSTAFTPPGYRAPQAAKPIDLEDKPVVIYEGATGTNYYPNSFRKNEMLAEAEDK